MTKSKIPWTDEVWNPLRGCSPASVGCGECHACRMAGRFCGPGQPYEGLVTRTPTGWKWNGEVRLLPEKLEKPLHWTKPRLVLVDSMSDLFHRKVPDDFICQVWRTMTLAKAHAFQILTKRAARMEQWFGSAAGMEAEDFAYESGREWPLSNVWLGVSTENQEEASNRIGSLMESPAAIRFLSCEPLIGPIDLTCLSRSTGTYNCLLADPAEFGIHQVIVGCQTGPKSRIYEMKEDWVRDLRDQCTAHDVAFFYKQKLDENGVRIHMPSLDGRVWEEQPRAKE